MLVKFLNPDGSSHFDCTFKYSLPTESGPGDWVEAPGTKPGDALACGPNRLHVCKSIAPIGGAKFGTAYEAEGEELIGEDEYIASFRRIRLIRLVPIDEIIKPLANLAGANLDGANLAGANLAWANLAGADLDRSNLAGANLVWANLVGANLVWANLAGADLDRANLVGANLAWANLAGANLAGANLAGANLDGANLDGANLVGAKKRALAGSG